MTKLSANGLDVPADFPRDAYETLTTRIGAKWSTVQPAYANFAGATNAIAYRYLGAVNCARHIDHSLAKFGTRQLTPQERYLQEDALFGLFTHAYAALESTSYACFAMGAIQWSSAFPIDSEEDQRKVSLPLTRQKFGLTFPGDTLTDALAELADSRAYDDLRKARNILNHRGSPGRTHHVGGPDRPTEWDLENIELLAGLGAKRVDAMAASLRPVLLAAASFAEAKF